MSAQMYVNITGALFAVIAVIHLARLTEGWEAQIAGWIVPLWVSWVFLVIAGILAYSALRIRKNISSS